jgi:short-subunit dehydrogenase
MSRRELRRLKARDRRPIDVLINNAGIAAAGVTEGFTSDQAKLLFNTNVVGILRMTRAVLPAMRRLSASGLVGFEVSDSATYRSNH